MCLQISPTKWLVGVTALLTTAEIHLHLAGCQALTTDVCLIMFGKQ